MDERAKREGIEGIVVIACCLLFASGVGMVTHTVGWFLIALPVAFVAVRTLRNYGK
jgi:hypothetical protein